MIRVKKRGTTPGVHLQNLQGSEGEGGAADYFCNCLDNPPSHSCDMMKIW